jgi:prevent-host-death family protein
VTIFSSEQPVTEVTATTLHRDTSSLLNRVAAGERLIITRGGRAAALLVSLSDGIEIMLAGAERFALLRHEARQELEEGVAELLEPWRIGTGSS